MTIKKIGDFTFIGESSKTRNGFKHHGVFFRNETEVDEADARYTNRTYEAYEYQTVFKMAVNEAQKNHFITAEEFNYLQNNL